MATAAGAVPGGSRTPQSRVARLDPTLHREIARFGATDLGACMSCGVCTATCSLAGGGESYPRRLVHQLQVGDRYAVARSLDPWLCYFCGECSDACPRNADPAGTMMAARRYLTAAYDWTGLGRLFYRSPASQLTAMAAVAAAVMLAFVAWHGPMVTEHVALNVFAPVRVIELADWIMAAVLAALLLGNAARMVLLALDGSRPPATAWVRAAPTFLVHFLTQKRWRGCDAPRRRWLEHLLLVSGYLTMLLLVVVGLRWFQTDEVRPILHPTRLLGYYSTGVLLYVTGRFLVGRMRAREPIHRRSAESDWAFLVLLFLAALTGILVHVFRLAGAPLTTYALYVVHLAIVAPLLILEVPFGKWSHMLYRPLALYLTEVKRAAAPAAAGR